MMRTIQRRRVIEGVRQIKLVSRTPTATWIAKNNPATRRDDANTWVGVRRPYGNVCGAVHPMKVGKRGQERRGGLHTYASEYGTNGEGVHLEHLDNLLRRVSHGQQDMRH